jgi:hypothetical protein
MTAPTRSNWFFFDTARVRVGDRVRVRGFTCEIEMILALGCELSISTAAPLRYSMRDWFDL